MKPESIETIKKLTQQERRVCSCCASVLGIENSKLIRGKYLSQKCTICINQRERELGIGRYDKAKRKGRYERNKDAYLAQNAEYRRQNAKIVQEKDRLRKSTKEGREKIRIRESKRLNTDPVYKFRKMISIHIGKALKRNGSSKEGSILKYLPYTIKELKEHIEKQFEPWMNWENHGKYVASKWDDDISDTWKWQLDHIIPHSDLPYKSMTDENFKKCWSLNNLRPLSAKKNVLDGANRSRHK